MAEEQKIVEGQPIQEEGDNVSNYLFITPKYPFSMPFFL